MIRAIINALRWVKSRLFKRKGTKTVYEITFSDSAYNDLEVYLDGLKMEHSEDYSVETQEQKFDRLEKELIDMHDQNLKSIILKRMNE